VLGWVVAIGVSAAVLDYFQLPRVGLFLYCAGAVALFPLVFARLCRFESKV
jgi:hypothetical protein